MVAVALLSNPTSTGNRASLPEIRSFCAERPEVFHYEVEHPGQTAAALESIARAKPRVLVINGGDGTVQAALTEMHNGGHFDGNPPPVAVLPSGKTNLIALDLGWTGDPLAALEEILRLAKTDMADHLVQRELIALTEGEHGNSAVQKELTMIKFNFGRNTRMVWVVALGLLTFVDTQQGGGIAR